MDKMTVIGEDGFLYLMEPKKITDVKVSMTKEKNKQERAKGITMSFLKRNSTRQTFVPGTTKHSGTQMQYVPVFQITDPNTGACMMAAPMYNVEIPGEKKIIQNEDGVRSLIPSHMYNENVGVIARGISASLTFSAWDTFGYHKEMVREYGVRIQSIDTDTEGNLLLGGIHSLVASTLPSFWLVASTNHVPVANTKVKEFDLARDEGAPMYFAQDSTLSEDEIFNGKLTSIATLDDNEVVLSRDPGTFSYLVQRPHESKLINVQYFYYLHIPDEYAVRYCGANRGGTFFPPMTNIYDDCHVCMGPDSIDRFRSSPTEEENRRKLFDTFLHGHTLFSVSGSNSDLMDVVSGQYDINGINESKKKAMRTLYAWDSELMTQIEKSEVGKEIFEFIKSCPVTSDKTRAIESCVAHSTEVINNLLG